MVDKGQRHRPSVSLLIEECEVAQSIADQGLNNSPPWLMSSLLGNTGLHGSNQVLICFRFPLLRAYG